MVLAVRLGGPSWVSASNATRSKSKRDWGISGMGHISQSRTKKVLYHHFCFAMETSPHTKKSDARGEGKLALFYFYYFIFVFELTQVTSHMMYTTQGNPYIVFQIKHHLPSHLSYIQPLAKKKRRNSDIFPSRTKRFLVKSILLHTYHSYHTFPTSLTHIHTTPHTHTTN